MQSKLYGLQIERALVNAVFEATDTTDGSTVFVYEWTPPLQERGAAKQRLADAAAALEWQVLSSDASLYLVTRTREEGDAALAQLQTMGLFTDFWQNNAVQLKNNTDVFDDVGLVSPFVSPPPTAPWPSPAYVSQPAPQPPYIPPSPYPPVNFAQPTSTTPKKDNNKAACGCIAMIVFLLFVFGFAARLGNNAIYGVLAVCVVLGIFGIIKAARS